MKFKIVLILKQLMITKTIYININKYFCLITITWRWRGVGFVLIAANCLARRESQRPWKRELLSIKKLLIKNELRSRINSTPEGSERNERSF